MLIELQNLTKEFQGRKVIDNFNFQLAENEIVALIGPSGCGKSTILNLISGIIKEYEGTVYSENAKIAYVFQEDRLLPWLTVAENIEVVQKEKAKNEISDLIKEVGLAGFETSFPHSLSGGMRQRCAIARGFYYDSNLLLMDEPFKSLDYNLRMEMLLMLLRIWEKKKRAIVFVTHEIDEALLTAHRILVLGKSPTKIVKEIRLGQEHMRQRDLTTDQYTKYRNEIIACLKQ